MHKIIITLGLAFIITIQGLEIPIPSGSDYLFQDSNDVTPTVNSTKINYRLPTDVIPSEYNIKLTPYLDGEKQFTFDGVVIIKINVLKDVKNIILHAKNLNISSVTLTFRVGSTETEVEGIEKTIDEKTNFLTLQRTKNESFTKQTYNLKIIYVGILDDDMRGFYRSSYINDKGEKVWLATTHFEPVDARRAFPCFDEPAFKATFEISIEHDQKYTALSNKLPTKDSPTKLKDKFITSFEKTPVMSTYLVAFVVSDFKSINNPKNFTVAARSNAIVHGDLALKSGLGLLQALENFTQVDYEMGKMDQVAIPDFSAGAMENWGLVLYREKSLLFDGKTMTTNDKQNIVETIAHEFAHQWFGNLVSPKWWKYIWLNEGFANFFQSYITDKVEPEWRSVEQAVVKSIQTITFDFDCESKTHPINHDVESPEEIRALFDTISYKKGGAVIRMMQHFLTEPIFQQGLTYYLKDAKTSHKAADSDDLFNAIQEVVKKANINLNVPSIMNTWVNSKGYPVVTINTTDPKNIKVEQERFYTYTPSEEEKKNPSYKHIWKIPINYATQKDLEFSNTSAQYWLTEASGNLPISLDAKNFIILNKQHTGYYRVQYDNENWNLIAKYLSSGEHKKIHVLNRAQLMNDALAFTKLKKLDTPILLNIINHLKNETDYIAWYPGFKAFSWLKSKLINTDSYPAFKKFATNRMKPLIESVGLEEAADESENEYLTKLNRITALDWACRLDVELNETSCTTKMQKKLEDWLVDSNKNFIPPDLKQVTLCSGLRNAKFEVWEKALNKTISKKTSADEKKELMSALACSSDKTILEYYFNTSLTANSTLENDTLTIIQNIHQNSEVGIDVVLDLISTRLTAILLKTQQKNVFTLLGEIAKKITTTAQLEKLQSGPILDLPKNVLSPAVKAAQDNIDWLKENEDLVKSTIDKLDNNGVTLFSASILLISSLLVLLFTSSY